MKHTVQIVLKSKEEGIGRLVGVFRRRGYQIESLLMTMDQTEYMRIIVTVTCNQLALQQLLQHIDKLIDVVTVEVADDHANSAEIYIPAYQSA